MKLSLIIVRGKQSSSEGTCDLRDRAKAERYIPSHFATLTRSGNTGVKQCSTPMREEPCSFPDGFVHDDNAGSPSGGQATMRRCLVAAR